jgi:hypothetical protein
MGNTTSVINKGKFAFYLSIGIVTIIFILASLLAMMGAHTTFADVPALMLAIVAMLILFGFIVHPVLVIGLMIVAVVLIALALSRERQEYDA